MLCKVSPPFSSSKEFKEVLLKNSISKKNIEYLLQGYEFTRYNLYEKIKRRSGEIYQTHIDNMLLCTLNDGFRNPNLLMKIILHDFDEEKYKIDNDLTLPDEFLDYAQMLDIITPRPDESKKEAMQRVILKGSMTDKVVEVYDLDNNTLDPQNLNKNRGITDKYEQIDVLEPHLSFLPAYLFKISGFPMNAKKVLLQRLRNSRQRLDFYTNDSRVNI